MGRKGRGTKGGTKGATQCLTTRDQFDRLGGTGEELVMCATGFASVLLPLLQSRHAK
jgi:hypothetical protein